MAATTARPHSVAYSDRRRAASVDFHPTSGETSAKRSVSTSQARKSRTKSPEVVGQYILYSTLGQGSMGKVKLARHRKTGQLAAVKILPKMSLNDPNHKSKDPKDTPEHRHRRTEREIAIMLLLNHSNICKLLHWEIHDNSYYIFLEYVDGGQLLDYIIRHGKLKERQARRFGRQILSAIDYCHRNSIVHRDLKIENILLTRDENIKIIDFGLSNLYSPKSMLSTFCGSLYFAAPELLQATKYTGPEVDVWSFGVVLFVLVTGRVPFDDTSMPALHAKIKSGVVEYPDHMSRDCVDLLKSILVVDSKKRATIAQIAAHPWMNKRYEVPITNELPRRSPLAVPVDIQTVEGMHGFGLGDTQDIKDRLESIIATREYQAAAKFINKIPETYRMENIPQQQNRWRLKESPPKKVIVVANDDPLSQPAMYDPLLSIYYLVKERQERNRQDLISANDAAVPELSIAENPKPIIINSENSSNEKRFSKQEKKPEPSNHSPSNHIKFTASTKAQNGEMVVSPPSSTSTPSNTDKRASKRLSALFQTKRFSKDTREPPSNNSIPLNNASSSDDLSKHLRPNRNSKTPPAPSSQFPTPTGSLSTPIKRSTFQQNVNSLGRRLTFKPKPSQEAPTPPLSSNEQLKKPTIPRPRTTSPGPSPNRTESKSPSKSLRLDTRKARNAISGVLNGTKSPKNTRDSTGANGFQLFKLNNKDSSKDIKPKQEALQGLKGLAKNQLFHIAPEELYQHLLKVLEELNIEISIRDSYEVPCQWRSWKQYLQESSVSVGVANNSSRSSNTLDSLLQRRSSVHNAVAREADGTLSPPSKNVNRKSSSRRLSHTLSESESPSHLVFDVIIFSVSWAKRYGIRVQAIMTQDEEKYSHLFKKAEQLILNALEERCRKHQMITI
ncbi:hypothetical protein K450DRAFT_250077 [Umbelopsis ramanniana AG]|uniref:non-specific serine/threonine protein kinase n=1 Tax=Umbelopsis ramanniana AG TaxID=1314678 RepID=A0AAD5HD45_UMBRA|nr:uncharacterized protein K450DRAFT_250077 [Umbelopsis ramanniana AG]KAI8577803.1 hypothetical protein K450DRAFT_250077 [Umbelopsis ramanniana AG]